MRAKYVSRQPPQRTPEPATATAGAGTDAPTRASVQQDEGVELDFRSRPGAECFDGDPVAAVIRPRAEEDDTSILRLARREVDGPVRMSVDEDAHLAGVRTP